MTQASDSASTWRGKNVLITGVCGTIGRELLTSLCRLDVGSIVGIDSNETELFFLKETMRAEPRVRLFLCDIRIPDQLVRRMDKVDIVLHCAAYKHVDICERSPHEAVLTNILGTQNVIGAALDTAVERVIFTSSDKAVNPTSVMGTSKLMGERLMTAAAAQTRGAGPVFASIRFGNVLASRGSVVPLFKGQIAAGGPLTLTDRGMSRFMMSIEEAARLVMDAVFLARGGEVIVTKMPVFRIEDLAAVLVEELAPKHGYEPASIGTTLIGSKPGEKLYEELTNDEEVRRTFDWGKYLIIKPAFSGGERDLFAEWAREGTPLQQPYNSSLSPAMGREEIREFLRQNDRA